MLMPEKTYIITAMNDCAYQGLIAAVADLGYSPAKNCKTQTEEGKNLAEKSPEERSYTLLENARILIIKGTSAHARASLEERLKEKSIFGEVRIEEDFRVHG